MPLGFVAMTFCGVLVGVARPVFGPDGGLLVRCGSPPVRLSCLEVALGSCLVRILSALECLVCPLVCPRGGRRRRRHAVCQLGLSLLQLLGARAGQVSPVLRRIVV